MGANSRWNIRGRPSGPPTQMVGVNRHCRLSRDLAYLSNMSCRAMDEAGMLWQSTSPTLAVNGNFGNGPFGPSIKLTGSQNDAVSFQTTNWSVPTASSGSGTIEVLCSITGTASRAHLFGIMGNAPNTGVNTARRAIIAFNGSSPYNIYFWEDAGGDMDSTVLFRNDGSLQHIFVGWGKAAGETTASVKIWRDGAVIKTGTPTLHDLGATNYVYFGQQIPSGAATFTAHIYKAAVYFAKLGDSDVAELTADPWQQYNNPFTTIRDYGVASETPPSSFNAAWAVNANVNHGRIG